MLEPAFFQTSSRGQTTGQKKIKLNVVRPNVAVYSQLIMISSKMMVFIKNTGNNEDYFVGRGCILIGSYFLSIKKTLSCLQLKCHRICDLFCSALFLR